MVRGESYPSRRGRPSIPAPVIGSALALQALQRLSERETTKALTYDLRWGAASGYGHTNTAFQPSKLTYWGRRLAGTGNPYMEAITEVIAKAGVLKGKRRRAGDSALVTDAATSVNVLADSVYGSGECSPLSPASHTPLIKPWPLRPPVEGGFTLDNFIDLKAAGTGASGSL